MEQKKRVLIVDDALDLGRLLQTALKVSSPLIDAVVVPSAEEAMLEASRGGINLLVTDYRLPGMTGFELVNKIRGRLPALRVMMISGMSDDTLPQQAEQMKIDAFLHKPMDMADFVSTAHRCLELNVAAPGEAAPAGTEEGRAAVSAPPERLSKLLGNFRQGIGAAGVFLIDSLGRVCALAGDFPTPDFEEQWIPVLLTAISAGTRVSSLLEKASPEAALVFPGDKVNLVLVPVGNFALVITLKGGRNTRLPMVMNDALEVQKELYKTLEQMGVFGSPDEARLLPPVETVLPPAAPEKGAPELSSEELSSFEALLRQSEPPAKTGSLDSFWEEAGEQALAPTSPDVLSFDQARKLGLTPEG